MEYLSGPAKIVGMDAAHSLSGSLPHAASALRDMVMELHSAACADIADEIQSIMRGTHIGASVYRATVKACNAKCAPPVRVVDESVMRALTGSFMTVSTMSPVVILKYWGDLGSLTVPVTVGDDVIWAKVEYTSDKRYLLSIAKDHRVDMLLVADITNGWPSSNGATATIQPVWMDMFISVNIPSGLLSLIFQACTDKLFLENPEWHNWFDVDLGKVIRDNGLTDTVMDLLDSGENTPYIPEVEMTFTLRKVEYTARLKGKWGNIDSSHLCEISRLLRTNPVMMYDLDQLLKTDPDAVTFKLKER